MLGKTKSGNAENGTNNLSVQGQTDFAYIVEVESWSALLSVTEFVNGNAYFYTVAEHVAHDRGRIDADDVTHDSSHIDAEHVAHNSSHIDPKTSPQMVSS